MLVGVVVAWRLGGGVGAFVGAPAEKVFGVEVVQIVLHIRPLLGRLADDPALALARGAALDFAIDNQAAKQR